MRRAFPFTALVMSTVAALASLAQAPLTAQGNTAAKLLGPAVYAEVEAKGKAVRTVAGPKLGLLPAQSAAGAIRAAIEAENPSVVVETVFALPRRAPAEAAGRRAELAAIYGLMRSFGTLKGIEYYSVSRKAMRTLYVDSYRIDDEATRSPLPDPDAPGPDTIPKTETLLVYQKDLTLGANVYRYSFQSFPDAVLVETVNLTRMSYGIVPMVAPGGFRSRLLVIPVDDAILFYCVSEADPPGIVRARLGESLASRAEALFRWFSAQSPRFLEAK